MNEIQTIADNADLIVNGYAFTKCDTGYRVLNINNPQKAFNAEDGSIMINQLFGYIAKQVST